MNENTNKENKIYLVSIKLTELIINTLYPHLADSVCYVFRIFRQYFSNPSLSSIERLNKDSFDDVDYVKNVAKIIWDLGQ